MAYGREIKEFSVVLRSGKEKQDTSGYLVQMKEKLEKEYVITYKYHVFGKIFWEMNMDSYSFK